MADTVSRFLCPGCEKRLKAPASAAGRTVNCPNCGHAVIVPDAAQSISRAGPRPLPPSTVQANPPPALKPKPSDTYLPIPVGDELEAAPRRRSTSPVADASNLIVVQQPSRAAHSLGVASLVVGVLSVLVCWVPLLGILIGGLGLLLGVGGLALALLRRGTGLGFSIAGSGLSAVSLVLCWIWTYSLADSFRKVSDAAARQERTNQSIQGGPAGKVEDEWADASKGAVRQGDLQVQVAQVTIGQVPLKTITGNSSSKDNLLMVKLALLNTNPTKKMEYHSWSGKDISFDRDYTTLKDNFDNSYKRINFGLGSHPVGAVERSESLYPNMSVTDVLVFELPLDSMEYLRLELPAKNFGGAGVLRLQIPKAMMQR